MDSGINRKNRLNKLVKVTIAFYFLCLAACANNPASLPNSVKSTLNTSVNSSWGEPKAFDIPGFHIQSFGVSCSRYNQGPLGSNLVLATSQLKDSQVPSIQAMTNYAVAVMNNVNGINPSQPLPPPPENVLGLYPGSQNGYPLGCILSFLITNTGSQTVQVESASVELNTSPSENTYHYNLVDICSLLPPAQKANCPPSSGAGMSFSYSFALHNAPAHPPISGSPNPDVGQSPQPFIYSGSFLQIALIFTSTGSPANLVYTVTPEIKVISGGAKSTTLDLHQLTTQVFFMDPDQVSCYQLQGLSFIPSVPTTNELGAPTTWCL